MINKNLEVLATDINKLILDPANARTGHDIKGIAQSLTKYGQRTPIVVNKRNNIVLKGNGTLKAARQLGWSSIAVVWVDDDSQTATGYSLADNRLTDLSHFDDENLLLALQQFEDVNDVIGFDEDFFNELLKQNEDLLNDGDGDGDGGETIEDEPDLDKADELQQVWNVQNGDLWQLGEHRLICGDCTDRTVIERLMDGKRAEIGFTSPPYLNMRTYSGNDLSLDNLLDFIPIMSDFCNFSVVNLGLKFEGAEVVQYWDEYIAKFKACGNKLLGWNIWDKMQSGSVASATNMFCLTHEWLFVFGKERKRLNRTIPNSSNYNKNPKGLSTVRQADGTVKVYTTKTYTHHQLHSVIQHYTECGTIRENHPATMPIGLPSEYIKAMTDKNQLIYDPFLGSGTTLIAAEQTNRICYGSEISPKYCAVILQRYKDLTGNEPTKIE